MKTNYRKALFALSVIVAAVGLIFFAPVEVSAASVTAKLTQAEVINWLWQQEGQDHYKDNICGAQCVDFTSEYMRILWGHPTVTGNANTWETFARNNLSAYYKPAGTAPEPGDIFITTGGAYGHVGVVLDVKGGNITVIEQNVSGAAGKVESCGKDKNGKVIYEGGRKASIRYNAPWGSGIYKADGGLIRLPYKPAVHAPASVASEKEVPSGVYEIEWSKNKDLVWEVVNADTNNSVAIKLYKRNNPSYTLNERFMLSRDSSGQYTIIPLNSRKAVEIKGYHQNYGNGAMIQQYDKSGSDDALWWIDKAGNGEYSFYNATSAKAIDVKDGDGRNLQAWDYVSNHTNINQRFRLNKISSFENDAVAEWLGFSNVTHSSYHNKIVSIKANWGNGKFFASSSLALPVMITDSNSDAAKFRVTVTGDGWFQFKNLKTGKYLSARNDEDGVPIHVDIDKASMWETFRFYAKDGNLYIVSQANKKAWMAHYDSDNNPTGKITSSSLNVNGWEIFSILVHEDKPVEKCKIAGKVSLNADDPNCKEDKCTIIGKTHLNANDSNCKADPGKKLQYRYRDKQTKTASYVESGWNVQSEAWGDWGAWSSWSTNNPGASTDSRNVETRGGGITSYNFLTYKTKNSSQVIEHRYWSIGASSNKAYGEFYWTRWNEPLPSQTVAPFASLILSDGQRHQNLTEDRTAYVIGSELWFILSENRSGTEYRYRTRSKVYTVWKWGDWSNWQDAAVSGNGNREVETRQI